MDVAETLFQRLHAMWHRIRQRPEPVRPGAAYLEDERGRLQLLAALLCGEVLDLRTATGVGGVSRKALMLPAYIDICQAPARNADIYVYRTAYAMTSRALGLRAPSKARDAYDIVLASLLAVPGTREAMAADYPSASALADGFHPAVLSRHPPAESTTLGGILQGAMRLLLGAREPFAGPADQVLHVLHEALACRPRDTDELARRTGAVRDTLVSLGRGRLGPVPDGCVLWGLLASEPSPASADAEGAADEASPSEGARRSDVAVVDLDKTFRVRRRQLGPRENRPLYHVFEKVETLEEFTGQSATPDASDDAAQMKDAMQELSLGTLIRTADDPRNLMRADLVDDAPELEVSVHARANEVRAFRYPEWNHRAAAYRPDYCTVNEERLLAGETARENLAAAQAILRMRRRQVQDLRAYLHRSLFRRMIRNRQLEGPEIDVEAMVERHGDLTAGHTPPDRLYLDARKSLRDVAIVVLVDVSFSTDAWIGGRRVLDIEVQSLLVLAEAFQHYLDREVAVASFCSHTRHDVRFAVLKGFEDSWEQVKRVAPSLAAGGYTRIGAAIRHATAVLDATKARKKLLLLVSDGKPTDYDRYEGRYGQEDVARAVREARQRQVRTFGLAIEKQARIHLGRMLGPGAYRILPETSRLPDAMADVFLGMLTD